MTIVKICGLMKPQDAVFAAEAGADLLGLVFADSRRRIDTGQASDLVAQVRASASVRMAGVFVNESASTINRVAGACDLDYAQLSGEEPDDFPLALDLPAIQVIHVDSAADPMSLRRRGERTKAQLLLLDTAAWGAFGGTGTTFDWRLIPELPVPFLLAGGLTPENVGAALRSTRSAGVDVSSGVESHGVKDQGKIQRFIERSKGTDSLQASGK